MDTRCANFATLLAMAEGRLAATDAERWSSHVAHCPRCAADWQAIDVTHLALNALHDAELRAVRPPATWARVAGAAARPSFLLRLPSAVTDAVRAARALAEPAVAATFAALGLGLALGTWLALSTQHAPATAAATETYDASSLLTPPSTGISNTYFESMDAVPAISVHASDSAAPGVSGGVTR